MRQRALVRRRGQALPGANCAISLPSPAGGSRAAAARAAPCAPARWHLFARTAAAGGVKCAPGGAQLSLPQREGVSARGALFASKGARVPLLLPFAPARRPPRHAAPPGHAPASRRSSSTRSLWRAPEGWWRWWWGGGGGGQITRGAGGGCRATCARRRRRAQRGAPPPSPRVGTHRWPRP